jgi:hypothetical protein
VTHALKTAAKTAIDCCAIGLTATLLAGCGLSSVTSGLGGGMFGGSGKSGSQVSSVTEDELLSAAKSDASTTGSTDIQIAHGCPKFQVWTRDNNLTIYEPGKAGDALAVRHRGEITRTARECEVQPGRVTVKYGFSGRVLLGPKGSPGPLAFPVNVFVTDGKRERIAADAMRVDVSVAPDKPIGYFSMVRTISFAVPEGTRPGEFEIHVGFDRNVPGAG